MRYFAVVAELGSFTGAARELHVAQQPVSQQVKALEQLLGVTLLERGTLQLAYTLVSAFETVPLLLDRLDRDYPLLKVEAREVFGCDVPALLRDGDCDLALAPLTTYPEDIRQRTVRREVVRVAVGEQQGFAKREQIELASLRDDTLELWPHEMAPG
jgi:DNA-binding transcriptional LysR family regulator